MAESMQAKANKRIRGEILILAKSGYPIPVEIRTLASSLLDRNITTTSEITPHIDYLVGKGYLQFIDQDAIERLLKGIISPNAFVKLTPKGVDLIDGHIDADPGVDA